LLDLHGLSSQDFAPAMEQFLGTGAGLSAATITRLTTQWQEEARSFADRSLTDVDFVYLWVDGIHLNVRLEQEKLCLLVMIGVRADGRKELVALTDGYRESTESWADLLRDCKRRGMRAPVLAMGDGALGFWAALREVFPQTREQRCWFHKMANVLAAMPKSTHPAATRAMQEIFNAEDGEHARVAAKAFAIDYGAKFPKAVAKIIDDLDVLLAFYDYPAEHWIHLRTTNPMVILSRGWIRPGDLGICVENVFTTWPLSMVRRRSDSDPSACRAGGRFVARRGLGPVRGGAAGCLLRAAGCAGRRVAGVGGARRRWRVAGRAPAEWRDVVGCGGVRSRRVGRAGRRAMTGRPWPPSQRHRN